MPFLVVLAMIGGGVGFALVGGDDRSPSASKGDTTEPALPEITNSTPQTVSETQTTTVADCAEADPLAGTEPAIGDAGTDSPPVQGAGEQIPEVTDGTVLDDGSGSAFDDPAVPSMEPDAGGARTITVDEEGYLCADDATSNDPSDPNDPSPAGSEDPGSRGPTTPAPSGGGGSGDWPSGKEGWTVIVAGYDTQERARQRAADVQEDGFDDVGVLFSSDFTSLCPGFHVVYSGVFDSQSEANDHKRQLERAGDYAGSYVREISASGSRPSGCAAARTGT